MYDTFQHDCQLQTLNQVFYPKTWRPDDYVTVRTKSGKAHTIQPVSKRTLVIFLLTRTFHSTVQILTNNNFILTTAGQNEHGKNMEESEQTTGNVGTYGAEVGCRTCCVLYRSSWSLLALLLATTLSCSSCSRTEFTSPWVNLHTTGERRGHGSNRLRSASVLTYTILVETTACLVMYGS